MNFRGRMLQLCVEQMHWARAKSWVHPWEVTRVPLEIRESLLQRCAHVSLLPRESDIV